MCPCPLWTRSTSLQVALLCWLSHLHLVVGDGTVGGALLGSGSLQGEVGQLGRAKPLCLKFHPDPPDRPFFPISVCHGPWAGPTPVKELSLEACSAPGPGEALRMGAGLSERPTLFL